MHTSISTSSHAFLSVFVCLTNEHDIETFLISSFRYPYAYLTISPRPRCKLPPPTAVFTSSSSQELELLLPHTYVPPVFISSISHYSDIFFRHKQKCTLSISFFTTYHTCRLNTIKLEFSTTLICIYLHTPCSKHSNEAFSEGSCLLLSSLK
jgi:hypothetical protein